MLQGFKRFVPLVFVAWVCVLLAYSQDSQSLGDAARQARQQKANKEAQIKTGQAPKPKVITNEELPEHSLPATNGSADKSNSAASSTQASDGAKASAEQWKSQIQAQKEAIKTLQSNIDKVNSSIQFTGTNCVSGCAQWNERQIQKQQEVEQMRSQLETQKQQLQQMQESARQQGYGSSVYDP